MPCRDTADIDVDHPVPLVDLERRQRGERHHAGVVDEDVDGAELRFGEVRKGRHVVEAGDVEGADTDLAAAALDVLRDALEPIGSARPQHHAGAVRRKDPRGPLADAARRPGDEHDLVVQGWHEVLRLLFPAL